MEKERKLAAITAHLGRPILSFPARDEYVFICPRRSCGSNAKRKPKLAVNVAADMFNCWVCGFSGRNLAILMPPGSGEQRECREGASKAPTVKSVGRCTSIPSECTPVTLSGDPSVAPYVSYLRRRGITDRLLALYRIMSCDRGEYAGRVVFPSFDSRGDVNMFVARTIWDRKPTYMMPDATKDIIFNEHLVDWSRPVCLTEGIFDAIAVGTQAIPMLGKFLQPTLAIKLIKHSPLVHVCLDSDAGNEAWELAEQLLSYDVPCSVVKPPKKDPADSGHDAMLAAIGSSRVIDGPLMMALSRSLA